MTGKSSLECGASPHLDGCCRPSAGPWVLPSMPYGVSHSLLLPITTGIGPLMSITTTRRRRFCGPSSTSMQGHWHFPLELLLHLQQQVSGPA